MNDTQAPLNGFEQRLLAALQDEIKVRTATTKRTTRRPSRTTLALAGAAVVIGAIGAVATPLLAGQHGAPRAFAVSTSADGTVTAVIYRFQDAAGLQKQLGDAGVTAVVQYAPTGKACERPSYTHLEHTLPHGAISFGLGVGDNYDGASVTVEPSALHGLTLVLTLVEKYPAAGPRVRAYASSLPEGRNVQLTPAEEQYLDIGVTDDSVGPCTLIDDPKSVPSPR